jgi:NAD-dependent deacetylase
MKKPKIVVLTGAGMSAESGLKTFRDSGGLWEGMDVMEVASIDGWRNNPALVLHFYNERRRQLLQVQPNEAHHALARMETSYDISIVTQNVDDLHERAGSNNIIHLHGELLKMCDASDKSLVYHIEGDIELGDKKEGGQQLRPFIVWFGEDVPLIERAIEIVQEADILIIIGTSMVVYPAAGLIQMVSHNVPIIILDPVKPDIFYAPKNIHFIEKNAVDGISEVLELIQKLSLSF